MPKTREPAIPLVPETYAGRIEIASRNPDTYANRELGIKRNSW